MKKLKVAWSEREEADNLKRYGIGFKEAREVVLNSSSLRVRNLDKDFVFIGPVDDLGKILVVYCSLSEGFRKIEVARKASKGEESCYFNHLAEGELV